VLRLPPAAAVETSIGRISCSSPAFCWSHADMPQNEWRARAQRLRERVAGDDDIIGGMSNPHARRAAIQSVKTHRDARGTLFEPLTDAELRDQKNVHVVLTQPNEVRGNHVHRTAVETTTVVGPCRVRLKEEGEIKDIDVAAGDILRLTIPPGVVHAFRNTGNSAMILVSFSTNLHDPEGADTEREQIL
jgi:dTDP-4-dehydrorhamnose 3,5-epimerase-like enzyme